jgi:hypothetical protein
MEKVLRQSIRFQFFIGPESDTDSTFMTASSDKHLPHALTRSLVIVVFHRLEWIPGL